MIPAVRHEVHFVFVGDTNRRRFTKHGTYMAVAYAAIERRVGAMTDGCGCEEYDACHYHHPDTRDPLAKRLARWLMWRDKRFGLTSDATIPGGKRARTFRMKRLQEMRVWVEAEMVRLDVVMKGSA